MQRDNVAAKRVNPVDMDLPASFAELRFVRRPVNAIPLVLAMAQMRCAYILRGDSVKVRVTGMLSLYYFGPGKNREVDSWHLLTHTLGRLDPPGI
ncbi:unnamed protein product [Protopolystoma xenopodis]|uniref:Uncharacterized protein n=1 Tax=Protopolystoma xenopodis TaxID=117903 RepID=A0A3S5BRI8_9PLAT|nr:unnamed protein product [Protopolystoma xenopodis]